MPSPKAAVVIATLAASTGLLAAPALARHYPFCINGAEYNNSRDCRFVSYQQCQASASGRYAFCEANPFFNSAPRQSYGYMKKPQRQYQN